MVRGWTPVCPALPHPGVSCLFAKASGYHDAEHLLPAAPCPGEETEFDPDNKNNWIFLWIHVVCIFFFILPEAFAQQKSQVLFTLQDT